MNESADENFPVSKLSSRYNLARSAVYKRMADLGMSREKVGNRAYLNLPQLALLDELHSFIQGGGNVQEFRQRQGLAPNSMDGYSDSASTDALDELHSFIQGGGDVESFLSQSSGDYGAFTLSRYQGRNQYYLEAILEGVMPLRMMRIPAGTCLIGSPADELDRSDSEGPQHEVSISQFFISKYPVTQAQWQAVAAMPKVKRDLKASPSHFKGELLPVESVTWYEAVEFCDRLTIHTDRQYRLPTEAEWEYACRAGTNTPFYFGETITTELANYRGTDREDRGWSGSYGDGPKGEYREQTTSVDQFNAPNAYGLCDMHGNVDEWCQDHWYGNYKGAPTDSSAWLTDDENAFRILRGGSWDDYPRSCRSAARLSATPKHIGYGTGFRVSCAAPRTLIALNRIHKWLDGIISDGWQAAASLINPSDLNRAFLVSDDLVSPTTIDVPTPVTDVSRAKLIDLSTQLGESIQVALVVRITQTADGRTSIILQVCPLGKLPYLPEGIELTVLNENNVKYLETTSRTIDNYIQLRFIAQVGEQFSVRIRLGQTEFKELFSV